MIAGLIVFNFLVLAGLALYCHALVAGSRKRAERALLLDLAEKGARVERGAAGLPDWCRDGLHGMRGCEWWTILPGEPSVILCKESGRPRRLIAAWRSQETRPVRMALLIQGRFGQRSSSAWLPRQPHLPRRFLGWNRLKAHADDKKAADRLLRETDLGWSSLRASPARDKAVWYLSGSGFLLSDCGAVSSAREAALLCGLARRIEDGLTSPPRGWDGSADPAALFPEPRPGESGSARTGTYVTGEVWERFGMIAWMWFPYGVLTAGAEKMRTIGPQAGCAALFVLVIVLVLLSFAKHRAVARAGSWAPGTFVDKHSETDSDGTAYWVEYEFEGADGRRARASLGLMGEEWERAGPGWRTVVFPAPGPARGPFPSARARHAAAGPGLKPMIYSVNL